MLSRINFPYPFTGQLMIETEDMMSTNFIIKKLQDLLDRDPESLSDREVELGLKLAQRIAERRKKSQSI